PPTAPKRRSTGQLRYLVSGLIPARGVSRGDSGCGRPAARLLCGLSRVPGSGTGFWVAAGAVRGCGPVRGWSGRCGGRPAGRIPEVQPFLLAVPGLGQVQGAVAPAVPG